MRTPAEIQAEIDRLEKEWDRLDANCSSTREVSDRIMALNYELLQSQLNEPDPEPPAKNRLV